MYKYVAEAFVSVAHARYVAEKVCLRIKDFCRSIGASGSDNLLDFGEGRATLRPTDDGLFLRVGAEDLVTFYGIRTLFEGSVLAITQVSEEAIEWLPAGSALPGAIRGHLKNGQSRPGGH
jgi:hypothetical protein